ncbi:MAG: hypothetical protein P1V97_07040 [Planctomycetota bacterium]|nr:hypothetical protein [Planctomycetota bacterium]
MFPIWPQCEQCGLPYELSEYELNQSLDIPRIVFCSDCHHTFVLDAEEVHGIREMIEQTMNAHNPWDDDSEDPLQPILWSPENSEDLEAEQLEKMANQGNTMAMLVLGALYCQGGFGLQRDYEQARYWWQMARDHGESEAVECLQQLEFELTPEALDADLKLPPHWFALRELHSNLETPISFSNGTLETIEMVDIALFGPPGIDGQRPDMSQESLQTQDKIVYEALRQALPAPCLPCFAKYLKAQFDLEFSLLIQDFEVAAEFGEEKLKQQSILATQIKESCGSIEVTNQHLRQSLDLLKIDVLF